MAYNESEQATLKDMLDLLNTYKSKSLETIKMETVNNDNFDADVERFLGFGDMKAVIISPEAFPEGEAMKKALIDGMIFFFRVSMASVRVSRDTRHKLFACMYDVRDHIDLLSLLEELQRYFFFCGGGLEDELPFDVAGWERGTKIYTMFEHCYLTGIEKLARIQTPSEAKKHQELIVAQQRIVHFLLLYGRKYGGQRYLDIVEEESGEVENLDALAAQIYMHEDVRIYRRFARKHLAYFTGEAVAEAFLASEAANTSYGLEATLQYIVENGIPYGVGYKMIETQRMPDLYRLFRSEATEKSFRLYALKKLVGDGKLSERSLLQLTKESDLLNVLKVVIQGEVSKALSNPETEETRESLRENRNALEKLDQEIEKRDQKKKEEPLLSQEEIAYWSASSAEIIQGQVYCDRRKMISCNMDAEVLMTALVLVSAGIADIDIVKSLQQMPEVLSFPEGTKHELIVGEHGPILLQSMAVEIDFVFFIDILAQYLAFKKDTISPDEVVSQLKARFLKE